MRTIIKSRGLPLSDPLKAYVEAKLQRTAATWVDGPAVTLEIEVADLFGPKGGRDKQCEVLMTLPRGRCLRIETASHDLYAAIDAAADRLWCALERYKGKKAVGQRRPTKYYVAKRLNAGGWR
jgi:ribosomal subunit interface protein